MTPITTNKSISSSSNNSIYVHTTSCVFSMQEYYRRIQQKSDGQTLLLTIPTAFAQAIQLQKADTVKMTLNNKSIVVQRAAD